MNKIPALMKPIEKVDVNQLRDKLSVLGKVGMAWEDDEQIAISWSPMMGTFLIIAIGGMAVWKIRRRRKLIRGNQMSMQQLEREIPSSVLYPYS